MPAGSNLVSLTCMTASCSLQARHQLPMFALEQLEEDIVADFIAGKPLIKSETLLRTIFKFKKGKTEMLNSCPE